MRIVKSWFRDNPRLARFIIAWLLFVFMLALSIRLGDFSIASPLDPPFVIFAVASVRVVLLAMLSVFNVYWILPFIKGLGKDSVSRQFAGGLIGLFGCFACALSMVMHGLGLSLALYATLTGMHILYWVSKRNIKKFQ